MHPANYPNNNFQSAPMVYYTTQNYPFNEDPPVLEMNKYPQPINPNNYTAAPPPPPLQPIYAISYPDNPYGMQSDHIQFAQYKPNFQAAPPTYADVVQMPTNQKPNTPGPFMPGYKWPRRSIQLVCPKCGATVITRVDRSITCVTILSAIILFILTCFLACIPFCISACKKSTHYCPYCNSILGKRDALR